MRHSGTSTSCMLALGLALASSASAVDYHVAPSGDDDNPGTAGSPWRTIAQANAVVQAGDTVWLHGGSYSEPIRPFNDGNSDSERIIYRAFGDGDVRLTGFWNTGNPSEGALALGEKRYVTVSGRGQGEPLTARRIRLEPQEDLNSLGNVCGSEGVVIENVYADCSDRDRNCNRGFSFCINFWEGDYETRYNVLRHSTFIGGSDVSEDANNYTEDLVSMAQRAHHNLIEDNLFSTCKHTALYIDAPSSHSNVIRGNRIVNPEHTGLSIWSAGVDHAEGARVLVENNYLAGSGKTEQPEGGPGNAFQWGSDELIIRYNVITQGGSASDQATTIGGLTGATSTSFGSPYFATDGRIYHNAIVDHRGVAIGMFDFAVDPVDLGRHVFINNMIYGSSSSLTGGLLALYRDEAYATSDRYVRNVWGNPGGDSSDEIIQNWHHGAADLATAVAVLRNPEDPELTERSGFANVYDAAPGFVDYSGGDFRLLDDSPYVDGAAPLTQIASSDSGDGAVLHVEDARFFFGEASEFPAWMGVESEWIAIGASFATAERVQIAAVDDDLNRLTVAQPIAREPGDSVWLWRDSSGREVASGAAPDIGSFEVSGAIFADGFESGDTSAWSSSFVRR